MDWEVQDYRKKPRKKEVDWIDWQVPREMASQYIWRMIFWVLLMPLIFFGQFYVNASYLLMLVFLVDYTSYLRWKQGDDQF